MSFFTFFQEMLQLSRQQIAELFLVLSILAMLEKGVEGRVKALLLTILSASIVVSHYALAYISMAYVIPTWILSSLKGVFPAKSPKKEIRALYVAYLTVFTLGWFMFVSQSIVLGRLVDYVFNLSDSIAYIFEIQARDRFIQQAIGVGPMISWGREIARIFFSIINFLILVGTLKLVKNASDTNFARDFVIMGFVSIAILFISVLLPYFSMPLNPTRLYHLTLVFLAPSCIMGAKLLFERAHIHKFLKCNFIHVILPVLIIYFLLSSGFVFEVTGDIPSSISLSKYRLDGPYYNEAEVSCAKWLINLMGSNQSLIFGDNYGWLIFIGYSTWTRARYLTMDTEQLPGNTYLFLRYLNVNENKLLLRPAIEVDIWEYVAVQNNSACSDVVTHGIKIYDNAYSYIYLSL